MKHLLLEIVLCCLVFTSSAFCRENEKVPYSKLWEGELYEVRTCFDINQEQPNFDLQKKIAEMIYWPEKADVAFLYSQLGNTDPGDFVKPERRFGYWEKELPGTGYYSTCAFGVGSVISGFMLRQKIADMVIRALYPIVQFPVEIAFPEFWISSVKRHKKQSRNDLINKRTFTRIMNKYKWRYSADELESVADCVEKYAKHNGINLGPRPEINHAKVAEINAKIPENDRVFLKERLKDWRTLPEKYPWFGYGKDIWGGRADKVILTCLCRDVKQCPDLVEGMTDEEKKYHCKTAEYKARLGYYNELQAAKNQPPKVNEEDQIEKASLQKTKPGCAGCGGASLPLSVFLGIFGLIAWAVWREGVFR